MNDLTMRFFADHVAKERRNLTRLGDEVANYRIQLAAAEEAHNLTGAHLRMLTNLQTQLSGEPGELAADDVQADEDILGVTIAGMSFAPDDDPLGVGFEAYAQAMRALYDVASHQARLAQDAINERRGRAQQTPPDGTPTVDPNPARALPVIAPAEIEAPPLADSGDCVHCKGRVTRTPSGLVHDATIRAVCYVDRPDSPYADLADPFAVGPDPEETDQPAPQQLHAYRVTFHKLGRQKNITPLELQASSIEQLERLIAIDAARTLGTFAEQITIEDDWRDEDDDDNVARGCVLRNGKKVGQFTVEQIDDVLRDAQPRPSADLVPPAHNEEATEQ